MQSKTQSKEIKTKGGKAGKIFAIILITLLLIAIIGVCAYIYNFLNLEVFYSGVTIDGIGLEGMSKEEALTALRDKHQPTIDQVNIVLQLDDMQWTFDQNDIAVSINIEDIVDKAYDVGREGTIIERLREIKEASENGKSFETKLIYDVDLISDKIAAIADDVNIEPVDATISFDPNSGSKFTFTDEKLGRAMLVEQALADIRVKVDNWDFTPYDIPVEELTPKYKVEELKTWTNKIASFSTKRSGSQERKHNIALSAKGFNGARIDPGETFSFNEATGPRDAKAGYKNAPVIKEGKVLVPEPGGGNCQTSSTLYAALIRADVEVVERYNHSWPSTYIDPGQDATVNYPNVDLKVKNNKDSALFLHSYISNDHIVVDIYGKPSPDYDRIGVVSDIISTTPAPAEKVTKDSSLYVGSEVVEYKSRPGYKVQTYRIYYKDGKEVKRVKEAYSNYPVITGKKRVGTKPKPVSEPPAPSNQEKTGEDTDADDSGEE